MSQNKCDVKIADHPCAVLQIDILSEVLQDHINHFFLDVNELGFSEHTRQHFRLSNVFILRDREESLANLKQLLFISIAAIAKPKQYSINHREYFRDRDQP